MLASQVSSQKVLLALSPEHRTLLSRLLLQSPPSKQQFHATWCNNINSVLSLLRHQHCDLLFISADFHDSDSNVLANLRQGPTPPAIIFLCDTAPENPDWLLEQGVQEILPINTLSPDKLADTFSAALSRERALRTQVSRAQNDVLTGLVNVSQFAERIEQAIDHAVESKQAFTVMLLNLDSFYTLNSNYGLKMGNHLILRTKERIQSIISPKATLARIGADEFAILIENIHSQLEVTRIAQRILDVVTTPIIVGRENAQVRSNLGIALYPQAGQDANTLLKNATVALECAKREPDNSYKRFNKEMEMQVRSNFMLDKQLRNAMNRDELELYYQPRVDLKTGKVVGAEALIRWNHPEHGLMTPDQFIPIAEESNLIIPLGYWIMERACQDWQALQEWGVKDIHLAINLSFKQFHDEALAETVSAIIKKYPIKPEFLEFELTETTVMHDPEKVCKTLDEIGQSGISFSLDDFGTGYSSFAHIITLPIEMIKIDRSFINGMEKGGDQAVIVQSIITLAHSLNLKVVSEGVEITEQREHLLALNCDQSQGYLFSKPLPFDDLCLLMAKELNSH